MPELKKSLDLSVYRLKKRLLLICAPASDDPMYERQIKMLSAAYQAEFDERDLLTFHLFENEYGYFNDTPLTIKAAATTRERLGVAPNEFTIILIGKDGRVRFRADRPTHPGALLTLVDTSAIRRRELKRQPHSQP